MSAGVDVIRVVGWIPCWGLDHCRFIPLWMCDEVSAPSTASYVGNTHRRLWVHDFPCSYCFIWRLGVHTDDAASRGPPSIPSCPLLQLVDPFSCLWEGEAERGRRMKVNLLVFTWIKPFSSSLVGLVTLNPPQSDSWTLISPFFRLNVILSVSLSVSGMLQ